MKPNIFSHSDYRTYLKEYYDWAKETNAKFSHRYFSKKVGFSSSNHFYLIIEGKRNLTQDYISNFSTAMGLSKKEQNYFEALISLNHAKTPESKRYYLELLHSLTDTKIGIALTGDKFEYYANWYYPIIRELVLVKDFCERPEWIRAQLNNKVTCKEVKSAIEILLRLGLLVRDEAGLLVQSEPVISTKDDACHELAYVFHDQMLVLAREILVSCEHEKREFSGMTVAVSKKRMSEVKDMMREFNNRLMRFLESPDETPSAVVQFNMQMFPVTKICGFLMAVMIFVSGCTNGISKIGNPTLPLPLPTNPADIAPGEPTNVEKDLSSVTKSILQDNPNWGGGCYAIKFNADSELVDIECEGVSESVNYMIEKDGSLTASTEGDEGKTIEGSLLENEDGYILKLKIVEFDGSILELSQGVAEAKEYMQSSFQAHYTDMKHNQLNSIYSAGKKMVPVSKDNVIISPSEALKLLIK